MILHKKLISYLENHKRSLFFVSEQTGIHYQRLYRFKRLKLKLNDDDYIILDNFLS